MILTAFYVALTFRSYHCLRIKDLKDFEICRTIEEVSLKLELFRKIHKFVIKIHIFLQKCPFQGDFFKARQINV